MKNDLGEKPRIVRLMMRPRTRIKKEMKFVSSSETYDSEEITNVDT